MTIVKLHRVLSSPDGTFGVLTYKSKPLCVTCENPWFNNQRNVSCIPNGNYDCVENDSPKFGKTWWLKDVPKRSEIIIHSGNTINHTEGCVLVGRHFGNLGDLPAVLDSKSTMAMLRRELPSEFTLIVTGLDLETN